MLVLLLYGLLIIALKLFRFSLFDKSDEADEVICDSNGGVGDAEMCADGGVVIDDDVDSLRWSGNRFERELIFILF